MYKLKLEDTETKESISLEIDRNSDLGDMARICRLLLIWMTFLPGQVNEIIKVEDEE